MNLAAKPFEDGDVSSPGTWRDVSVVLIQRSQESVDSPVIKVRETGDTGMFHREANNQTDHVNRAAGGLLVVGGEDLVP
jgi:hypothetical protein